MARQRQSEKKAQEQFNLKDLNIMDLGKDVGLTLMRDNTYANVDNWLPTGIPQYDAIMGGGIPFGRVTEVFGKKASGKSTFALQLSKKASELGVVTIWIDVEGTSDVRRLEQLGVDTDKVFAIQPKFNKKKNMYDPLTVESIADEIGGLLEKFRNISVDIPLLIIWDSIAATTSQLEIDQDITSQQPGIKAKALAKFFNRVTPLINGSNTALVAINQARDVMGGSFGFGDNIDSPGGKALEHVVSLQLLVNAVNANDFNQIKPNSTSNYGSYTGHNMQVETKKSKVSRPQQKAKAFIASEHELADGTEINGFNPDYIIIREAINLKIIESRGAWKVYVTDNGEELKMYEKDWYPYFIHNQNPEIIKEITAKVYYKLFPKEYPPFENTIIKVDDEFAMDKLKEYYANKNETPVESTESENGTDSE
ncbi:UvsX-like recombinase [Staphylococcus phage PG-2021_27]